MAVRMMVEEGTPGAEKVTWPGVERPIWMETSYVGAVLATRERNGYDDSDFYAVVWDEAEGRVRSIEYATTRGWTYPNGAVVDATEEVKAKARAWMRAWYERAYAKAAEERSTVIERGKRVRVNRGRKVPIGTEGTVFWRGSSGPRWQYRPDRIGLKTDAGETYWTAVNNVDVIAPEEYMPSAEEIAEMAANAAAHDAWHAPFVTPGFVRM